MAMTLLSTCCQNMVHIGQDRSCPLHSGIFQPASHEFPSHLSVDQYHNIPLVAQLKAKSNPKALVAIRGQTTQHLIIAVSH